MESIKTKSVKELSELKTKELINFYLKLEKNWKPEYRENVILISKEIYRKEGKTLDLMLLELGI